jgi:hypothetical protein
LLARLYWYTVEFGLVRTGEGLRIYGAGILSSGGEVVHAIDSEKPQRLMFDLERVMRTDYHIDRFQDTYFVIEASAAGPGTRRTTPVYERLRSLPVSCPDDALAGDVAQSRNNDAHLPVGFGEFAPVLGAARWPRTRRKNALTDCTPNSCHQPPSLRRAPQPAIGLYRIRLRRHSFRLVDSGTLNRLTKIGSRLISCAGSFAAALAQSILSKACTRLRRQRSACRPGAAFTFTPQPFHDDFFYNADTELLIVRNGNALATEPIARSRPQEIAVIPRGVRFAPAARQANAHAGLRLRNPAPVPAARPRPIFDSLANARDFLAPVAWYEDRRALQSR